MTSSTSGLSPNPSILMKHIFSSEQTIQKFIEKTITKDEIDKAISVFNTYLKQNPNHVVVLREIATLYGRLKLFSQSCLYLNQAVKQNPSDATIYLQRGLYNMLSCSFHQGMDDFAQAYALDNTILVDIALRLEFSFKSNQALQSWLEYQLKMNPGQQRLWLLSSIVESSRSEHAKALACLDYIQSCTESGIAETDLFLKAMDPIIRQRITDKQNAMVSVQAGFCRMHSCSFQVGIDHFAQAYALDSTTLVDIASKLELGFKSNENLGSWLNHHIELEPEKKFLWLLSSVFELSRSEYGKALYCLHYMAYCPWSKIVRVEQFLQAMGQIVKQRIMTKQNMSLTRLLDSTEVAPIRF